MLKQNLSCIAIGHAKSGIRTRGAILSHLESCTMLAGGVDLGVGPTRYAVPTTLTDRPSANLSRGKQGDTTDTTMITVQEPLLLTTEPALESQRISIISERARQRNTTRVSTHSNRTVACQRTTKVSETDDHRRVPCVLVSPPGRFAISLSQCHVDS